MSIDVERVCRQSVEFWFEGFAEIFGLNSDEEALVLSFLAEFVEEFRL